MNKANANKKQTSLIIPNIALGIVTACSIGVTIFGAFCLSGLGSKLDKENLKCSTKDYSSYVTVEEVKTPGNESINAQLSVVKSAMESAANDNDGIAFGQLYEKYNELLALQSQTYTTTQKRDDSKAKEAKSNCFKLALYENQSDTSKSIWVISIGGGLTLLSTISIVIVNILHNKKKHTKKH